MKNIGLAVLLFLGLGWFSSCVHCHQLTYCGYLPEMDKYFGMYVPGNWWVYYNQDSTKKDSVFISDFEEKEEKDRQDKCIAFPWRTFTLNFTNVDNPLYPSIAGQYYNDFRCDRTIFLCRIQAVLNENVDPHPVSLLEVPEIFYDSLDIQGVFYYNVIAYQNQNLKMYFAPLVGAIEFFSSSDTFYLSKSHIQ